MEGYKKYLKAIKNKNPMSEKQWKEAVGIVDEDAHTPLEVRPKAGAKKVLPKMELHT